MPIESAKIEYESTLDQLRQLFRMEYKANSLDELNNVYDLRGKLIDTLNNLSLKYGCSIHSLEEMLYVFMNKSLPSHELVKDKNFFEVDTMKHLALRRSISGYENEAKLDNKKRWSKIYTELQELINLNYTDEFSYKGFCNDYRIRSGYFWNQLTNNFINTYKNFHSILYSQSIYNKLGEINKLFNDSNLTIVDIKLLKDFISQRKIALDNEYKDYINRANEFRGWNKSYREMRNNYLDEAKKSKEKERICINSLKILDSHEINSNKLESPSEIAIINQLNEVRESKNTPNTNILNIKFKVSKIFSVLIMEKFKIFNIEGQLRVFTPKGEIKLEDKSELNHLLPFYKESNVLYSICHNVEKTGSFGKEIKVIHAVVSVIDDINLKNYATELVSSRELLENYQIEKQKELKRINQEKQRQKEEERKQLKENLERMKLENRQKVMTIKQRNREYMRRVISGEVPKNVSSNSTVDSILSTLFIKKERAHRQTHCFDCKKYLDSSRNIKCTDCSWILCSCGACGCTYNMYYH